MPPLLTARYIRNKEDNGPQPWLHTGISWEAFLLPPKVPPTRELELGILGRQPELLDWLLETSQVILVRQSRLRTTDTLYVSYHYPETFRLFIYFYFIYFIYLFIFISWRLITLQYCSGFCHTLTWISHGYTCVPPPNPPSHLPLHPIPLGLPSAPGPSTCLMHPTWAGDPFHPR